jgi:hypothetical protein
VSAREERAARLSRRRFVALAGASLAALSAGGAAPALGAEAKSAKPGPAKKPVAAETAAAPSAPPAMTPHQKEYERQKTGTLATLKTIRAFALPPGGDLPVVFKPMRTPKKGH